MTIKSINSELFRLFKNVLVNMWIYLLFNVIFAIFWLIYTHGYVIYYWDGGFPLNPIIFILRYINVWNSPAFPGGPAFGFELYLPLAILSIPFYLLGIPIGVIQWLITQFLANISLYGFQNLFRIFTKSMISNIDMVILILITLFYLINYYTLIWISEYSPNIILYFVTPVLIYYYIKMITANKTKCYLFYLFLISLLGGLGILYEDQTMDLYFLLFIIIFLLIIQINYNKKLKYIILKALPFFSVLILSGIYLFLYLYYSSLGAFKSSFEYFGNSPIVIGGLKYTYNNYNITNSLMLYAFNIPMNINIIIRYIYGFLFLSVILTPILIGNKTETDFIHKNKIYYYFIIFLLIILFGLQSGVINLENIYNALLLSKLNLINILFTGILYSIQYQHIGYPIYFLTSILFLFVYIRIRNLNNNKRYKLLRTLMMSFLALSFIIYSDVAVTHITSSYVINNIAIENTFNDPPWFKDVTNIISEAKYNNILILPIQNALSETLYCGETKTTIAANNPVESDYFLGEILSNGATSPLVYCILNIPSSKVTNFTNYLIILGVKYIIVDTKALPGPGTHARPFTNLPGAYPWNFTSFIEFLNNTPDLTLIGIYGPYYIYTINASIPLVYASNGIPANWSYSQIFWSFATTKIKALNTSIINNKSAPLIENISDVKIWYQIINNDEVKVYVNSKSPFYLVFDQGYNSLWELQINGKLDIYHFKANGYANAWLMPAGNYSATIILKTHNLQVMLYTISLLTPITLAIILLFISRGKIGKKDTRY
ncbi:hypothetical protein [Saccharolobus shibatae]|uniref:Uncharacterized protein n=1 Tax=Saccharolobus shibatae TaxID=2286 RepID=A0A8F5C0N6_9CREN|nr:hypothetical protein [Saccharolobus shibatae]QXJ34887.1 Uncharacterized protein J5U22_01434 [Saccharolobus shibatae]